MTHYVIRRSSRPVAREKDHDGWLIILIACLVPPIVGIAGLIYEYILHG